MKDNLIWGVVVIVFILTLTFMNYREGVIKVELEKAKHIKYYIPKECNPDRHDGAMK